MWQVETEGNYSYQDLLKLILFQFSANTSFDDDVLLGFSTV
jgi:hypothetical protein